MSLAEILTRKKRSSTFLNSFCLGKNVWWITTNFQARRERGGATGVLAIPPSPFPHRRQRSTFLLISNLKQSEVGILFYSNILIVY